MRVNSSRVYLDRWMQEIAASTPAGALLLDAGAGPGPYRHLFHHAAYESADFLQVDKEYVPPTYECDLTSIPVEDARFARVICSQTLEHLPDPVAALREFRRILQTDGSLFLTAPLFYEEHEQPYDFFRYTQFAWRKMADDAGFEVVELEWMEGYFGTLSYQCDLAMRATSRRYLPVRWALSALSTALAKADLRWKIVDRGMPKNYQVTMRPKAS